MASLRSKVIRLAHAHPEFRPELLSALRTASFDGMAYPTATDAIAGFITKTPAARKYLEGVVRACMNGIVESIFDNGGTPTVRDVVAKYLNDAPTLSTVDNSDYGAYKSFLTGWVESICRGPSEWLSVSFVSMQPQDLDTELKITNLKLLGEEFGDNDEHVEVPARTYEREISSYLRKSGAKILYEHSGMGYDRGRNTTGWIYEYSCSWNIDVPAVIRKSVIYLDRIAQDAIDDERNNPNR